MLRQLSSDTAESLTRAVEDYLKRPHISVLLRIPQGRHRAARPPFIEPVFSDALAESPFVESFYVWTEVGPRANKWLVFDEASKRRRRRGRTALPRRQVIGALLCRGCASWSKTRRAIVAFTETINGRPSTTCRRSCASRARRAIA